jgi:hypothetical protein
MGLLDLKIPMDSVDTPAGSFAVRGLSLEDLTLLYHDYTAEFGDLFTQFRDWAMTKGDDLPPMEQFLTVLIMQAPRLAASAIVYAADTPPEQRKEAVNLVVKLDTASQHEVLATIGRLTFRTEEDVKKMLELLLRTVQNLTASLLQMTEPKPLRKPGSGD